MSWQRALLVGIVLLVVALGLGFFWPFHRDRHVLVLPGVVEIQEVRLGSKIGGRVDHIDTYEGAIAEPGQPLVTFAVPELEAQREQLKARLDAAVADWEKAKNGPRKEERLAAAKAAEAAKAKADLVHAGWREEEKREAKSQLESARADLKLAREDMERAEKMYNQRSISRAEYDTFRANHDRAAGQSSKAQAHFDMLQVGPRKEEERQADADYERAKANHDLLEAGTREEEKAEAKARMDEARGKLREVEANLAEAVVRAPEKVLVEIVAVRKGDLVAPNQPILRVLRADDLWVKVYVPENEMGRLKLNQEVDVTMDSYPDRRFKGTIMHILAESEFTPRNVQSADERKHQVFGARVRVADPDGIFKSGMAAQVTVPLQ